MADGKGERILEADARIAAPSGRRFSQAYIDNIVLSDTEVLDSGYTAQAAALVHEQGAGREFAVRARLETARYVNGVSAADRAAALMERVGAHGVLEPVDHSAFYGRPEAIARLARQSLERVG